MAIITINRPEFTVEIDTATDIATIRDIAGQYLTWSMPDTTDDMEKRDEDRSSITAYAQELAPGELLNGIAHWDFL